MGNNRIGLILKKGRLIVLAACEFEDKIGNERK